MSNKTRLFSIVLGATALAGLTYGVARRGLQRRATQPLTTQVLASSQLNAASVHSSTPDLPDWETLDVHGTRVSSPDALDVAMSLDGIFDAQTEDGPALTVRPSDRVPAPFGGDDEEAPNADDLGLAWLAQATQAEHSIRQSDLTAELENIAPADVADSEETSSEDEELADSDETEEDEHADFHRTRA